MGHVDFAAEQTVHRGDGLAFAGDDPFVVVEIGIYVEGKAVRRNPAFYVNADGCDLTLGRVNAGQAFDTKCIDFKVGHCANQHFLEISNVTMNVLAIGRERDDRITDDLADSVISHAAAAVYLEDFDAERAEQFGRREDAVALRPATQSESMRMLQKQEIIAVTRRYHMRLELFLQLERRRIANAPQITDFQITIAHYCYNMTFAAIYTGRKTMKKLHFLGLFALLLAFFAIDAEAQKKTTKKPATRKTSTTKALLPPLEVRTAREKVDIQLSNVNEFLTKLASVAANLETAIADQKARKLRPQTAAGVDRARANLVKSIQDLGTALGTLESEFRTKPSLSKYLPTIQGISDLAADSENLAVAGNFMQARDPLREVAKKLTDTRALMPM